jgi:hypothetical protein
MAKHYEPQGKFIDGDHHKGDGYEIVKWLCRDEVKSGNNKRFMVYKDLEERRVAIAFVYIVDTR